MTDTDLFSPYDLGGPTLANRIVMAPLTFTSNVMINRRAVRTGNQK